MMRLDDGLDHRQTDAHAGAVRFTGMLAAVEQGGADLGGFLGSDADAGIFDGEGECATRALRRNDDRTAMSVISDGILDHDEEAFLDLGAIDLQ